MLHVGVEALLLVVSLSSLVAAKNENCEPYDRTPRSVDPWRLKRDERSQKLICGYLYQGENCTGSWIRLFAGQSAMKGESSWGWFWRDTRSLESWQSIWRQDERLMCSGQGNFREGRIRMGLVRPGCKLNLYEDVDFITSEFSGW